MLNYQLQIMGDEFVTSTGHDNEFHVNLLFDHSIYRPICTHMGEEYKAWYIGKIIIILFSMFSVNS